jgi:PAS domain S-box-containing protein
MKTKPTYEELEQRLKELEKEAAERKRMEDALKESDARHCAMVEAFDGLIYICSQDYRIEFMNQQLIERTGYNATGELCYRVLHDRDSICPWCINERVFQGETVRWEVKSPKDDRWYYIVNTPICHGDGAISKQAMILDITDRKLAEELLSAERRILEMVATGRPLQETLNSLCRMVEQLTPGTLCSILLLDETGQYLFHGVAPSLPEEYVQAINGVAIGPGVGSCGTAAYQGETVIVEDIQVDPLWDEYKELASKHGLRACWSVPIHSSTGKMLGTFALYDRQPHRPSNQEVERVETAAHLAGIVIERKRYEEAFWEREERYRTLFEGSRDAIYITTREGQLVDANQSALDLWGYTREEMMEKINLRDTYVHPQERDNFQEEIEKRGFVRDYEVKLRKKDGTQIACLLTATVRRSNDGRILGYQGIIRDITRLKTLERERTNLISMFAHDMKSALIAIQGFVLRLLNKALQIDEEKRDKYLNIIRKETKKLEFLVDDFLDFSRLQTGKLPLNFSPASLGRELLELFESYQPRALQCGIKLEIDNAESLPLIEADPDRLRRVFTNLLDNAFKFCREEGRIAITTRETEQNAVVEISDEGIGIDPQDLPYIFDSFHRGKHTGKYDGYGVGLAAVKTIVEGHGGKILVQSEPGKGSVFTVVLPKRRKTMRETVE